MASSVMTSTRLFFVGGLPSLSQQGSWDSVESLTFTELPRLPISTTSALHANASTDESSGPGVHETRPLVSPMMHLGRHSPLLRTALHNDRRWSRKLVEVTTWCIDGLPTGADGVCPIDETSLPSAGVRIRLCGRGGPLRIRPRRPSTARGVVTLSDLGACAWLQHGDVVELDGGVDGVVRLCVLAVQVRTSPAAQLAQQASFLWVQPAEATAPSHTPVAMWSARFADWSAVPKVLKAKMLMEAAQLLRQKTQAEVAVAESEDGALARWSVATTAPKRTSTPKASRGSVEQTPVQTSFEEALRVAVNAARRGQDGSDSIARSSSGSEARQDACAVVCGSDEDAATPTSESQQRRQQHQQQQLLHDRVLARSAPEIRNALEGSQQRSPRAVSLGRSPSSRRGTAGSTLLPPSPPRLTSTALSARTSSNGGGLNGCATGARYSCATFSETMDDKLHEALLNLENGGAMVGEALLVPPQQQHQQQHPLSSLLTTAPAQLLGALEDDDDDAVHHHGKSDPSRPPARWTEEEDVNGEAMGRRELTSGERAAAQHRQQQPKQAASRRATKRGGRGSHGRPSTRGFGGGDDSHSDEDVSPPKRRRRTSSTSVSTSLSQPQRSDGEFGPVAAPPLTRADMNRRRANQPAQEDSQVVFFDL